MANSYTKKPNILVLDTSGTAVAAEEIRIQAFSWITGTSAPSSVELLAGTGTGGTPIFLGTHAANETINLTLLEPLRVSGAYLKSLNALGKLLVYLAPSDRPYT